MDICPLTQNVGIEANLEPIGVLDFPEIRNDGPRKKKRKARRTSTEYFRGMD